MFSSILAGLKFSEHGWPGLNGGLGVSSPFDASDVPILMELVLYWLINTKSLSANVIVTLSESWLWSSKPPTMKQRLLRWKCINPSSKLGDSWPTGFHGAYSFENKNNTVPDLISDTVKHEGVLYTAKNLNLKGTTESQWKWLWGYRWTH